jgi:hypothetical protein
MISGYQFRDAFDEAVTSFAVAYADQTERDHEALVSGQDGRIIAISTGRRATASARRRPGGTAPSLEGSHP